MQQEWLLKRNCSLTPRQTGFAYGLLCLFTVAVAALFAARGHWFVPCFSLLELGGLAFALLHYARHATDAEYIALRDAHLVIDKTEAGRSATIRIDAHWARVRVPTRPRELIAIEARGQRVEVGRFVCEQVRVQVARQLQSQLRRTSALA
jgi:uncharacterized membrane protein